MLSPIGGAHSELWTLDVILAVPWFLVPEMPKRPLTLASSGDAGGPLGV